MNYPHFWLVVLFLGVGTFMLRGSVIFLSSRIHISDRLKEVLSFIPAAIFPALVMPMVYFHQGKVDMLFEKERFFVLLLATALCFKIKSILWTIVFGLVVLYMVTAL